MLDIVHRLKEAGVLVAIDDVGAGYAGLRQLIDLSPDLIKLDAGIVRGLHTDSARRAAAEALALYSRRVGVQCVFEGIETVEELETARSLGADMLQGFLVGRPAPLPDINGNIGTVCRES